MIGKQDRGGRTASDHGPRDSQQQLAQDLVACLGRDGAMHVCKVNGWQGVLDVLTTEDAAPADLHRH